jgi:uncharacterized alpha-E superfamily protein
VLSRIAESLFWVGRYVERADDTARILDVHVHDSTMVGLNGSDRHRALLEVMGQAVPSGDLDVNHLTYLLAFDEDNPSSIVRSISAARENARGARESISAEMWECLNATWHAVPVQARGASFQGPSALFRFVRERAALFAGLTDSTMSRDDGWRFLVLGRFVERVDMTSRLLATRVGEGPQDPHDWLTLLMSCSGYEAYLRAARVLTPEAVMEFLLLDRWFPRSILYALNAADRYLQELDRLAPDGHVGEARRVLARSRTRLEYEPFPDVIDNLGERLRSLQDACSEAGRAVADQWFRQMFLPSWAPEGAALS